MIDHRGVDVSDATIWRTLIRAGYSYKTVRMATAVCHMLTKPQITKAARERSAAKRAEYIEKISSFHANELIFIDESSFDKRTTNRLQGWGKVGERVIRRVHFHRGDR